MIEQFFQIGENWIDKEQYAFQLGDAILFLCFLIFVLYLFVFAIYSKRKPQYNYPTAKKKFRCLVPRLSRRRSYHRLRKKFSRSRISKRTIRHYRYI